MKHWQKIKAIRFGYFLQWRLKLIKIIQIETEVLIDIGLPHYNLYKSIKLKYYTEVNCNHSIWFKNKKCWEFEKMRLIYEKNIWMFFVSWKFYQYLLVQVWWISFRIMINFFWQSVDSQANHIWCFFNKALFESHFCQLCSVNF